MTVLSKHVLVAVALAALGGCRPKDSSQPLAVLATGDTAGRIVPCGGVSDQCGGLPRRGRYASQTADSHRLIVVDVGGAARGTSPYEVAKFEAILSGERLMGMAAHNLGASEVALGPEYLRDVAARLDVPFISANVRRRDGELLVERCVLLNKAGRRVAVLGVLDPKYATAAIQVDPPHDALLATLGELAGQYDHAIVLAYLPEPALRELAAWLPEVDVVVGGPTGKPIAPQQVGPVTLASATHMGQFLARFDAPPLGSHARWSGELVALDGQYEDDPGQIANLRAFRHALAHKDFAADQTGAEVIQAETPASYRIAGTGICRKCHEEDSVSWASSKHAHAWESLVSKGTYVDPDCQRCHTTGYGQPGGFASARRSPDRVHVGCEACHGPAMGHVRDPKVHTAFFRRAKDRCIACHDQEHSPDFRLDGYWAKIRHGHSPPRADAAP